MKKNKVVEKLARLYLMITSLFTMSSMCMVNAYAGGTTGAGGGFSGDNVTVTNPTTTDAGALMSKIIGILLTISRYVGVGLVIYGIYEVVMSFMQNQPEAKTKGIIMALSGVVLIGLKSILQGLGVVS